MNVQTTVIYQDGPTAPEWEALLARLYREAAAGKARVRLYRGARGYGSEAFYTLSDGTVLHETNETAEDGSERRVIRLLPN